MTVKPLVASEKRDTPKPGPFTKWRQQSFEDTGQTEEQVFVRTRHSWIHSGIDACGNVQPHMEMRIVYTIVMASHLIVAIVRLRLKESKVAEKTKLKVARAYPNASQEGTRAWKIAPKSIRDLFSGLIIRFAFTLPQFLFLLHAYYVIRIGGTRAPICYSSQPFCICIRQLPATVLRNAACGIRNAYQLLRFSSAVRRHCSSDLAREGDWFNELLRAYTRGSRRAIGGSLSASVAQTRRSCWQRFWPYRPHF